MKHVIACAVMVGLWGGGALAQSTPQSAPLDPVFEGLLTADTPEDGTLADLPNTVAGDVVRLSLIHI